MTSLSDFWYVTQTFGLGLFNSLELLLYLTIGIVCVFVSLYLYLMSTWIPRYPPSLTWPITLVLICFSATIVGTKYGERVENNRWTIQAANERKEFNDKLSSLNNSVGQIVSNYTKEKETLISKRDDLQKRLDAANEIIDSSTSFDAIDVPLHESAPDIGSSALSANTLDKITAPKVETKIKYVKVDIPKNYCEKKQIDPSIRKLIEDSGK
jgi:hypothetical protein